MNMNKKMYVLYYAIRYNPLPISRQLFLITKALYKLGYCPKVRVFVPTFKSRIRALDIILNQIEIFLRTFKTLVVEKVHPSISIFSLASNVYVTAQVLHILLRRKYAIFITGFTALTLRKLSPRILIFKALELISLKLAKHIILLSRYLARYLSCIDIHNKNVLYAPSYFLTPKFKKYIEIDKRPIKVLFVGRLVAEKGLMELLEAWKILERRDFNGELIILGKGPLYKYLESYIRRYKLKNVKLVGWVPPDKVIEYYNRARFLVLPSHSEGVPKAIIEALACGTPVIATDVGGIPDIVIHDYNGFIISKPYPKYIAYYISRYINDVNVLIRLSNNAIALVDRKYKLNAAILQWIKALYKLLQ